MRAGKLSRPEPRNLAQAGTRCGMEITPSLIQPLVFSKHPSFGFFTHSGLIIAHHHHMTRATAPGLMRLRRHRLSCFTVRVFPLSRAHLTWLCLGLDTVGHDTVCHTRSAETPAGKLPSVSQSRHIAKGEEASVDL